MTRFSQVRIPGASGPPVRGENESPRPVRRNPLKRPVTTNMMERSLRRSPTAPMSSAAYWAFCNWTGANPGGTTRSPASSSRGSRTRAGSRPSCWSHHARALTAPTDKSQSEKLRIPLSRWMLLMAGVAQFAYTNVRATFFLQSGRVAEAFWDERAGGAAGRAKAQSGRNGQDRGAGLAQRPARAGVHGGRVVRRVVAIGEQFARDCYKILRRNVSFGSGGVRRFWRSLRTRTPRNCSPPTRVIALGAAVAVYALVGIALYAIGVPQLTKIWSHVLILGLGLFVCGCCS